MKKVFNVSVSYDFVVVAEDEAEANEIAFENMHNAIRDIPEKYINVLVDEGPYIWAYGWDDECIPYGGDGNKRTKEYLEEISTEEFSFNDQPQLKK